jgi:hypothetical protein
VRRLPGLVATLLAVLLAGGCAALGRQAESLPGESYEDILERWTRSDREYDRLETRLYVSATYKSWPFRQAYVAEYARIFLLPDREREALLARETASFEQFHDFVLSAYTPYRQSGDFLTRTGIWKLYLEGPNGVQVPTSRVDRVAEPPQVLSAFYPYVNRWSRTFLVRFPRQTADGREVLPNPEREPFRLLITSTVARTALAWRP